MVPKQLFLVILFFLNTCSSISRSYISNESDHQALLALKASIIEDPLNALSSWNTSLNFCQWQGITCGARHRRVIAITLPSLGLHGTLPPQIGNLTFLRAIDLKGNNFHGSIPQEMNKLFRLTKLSLSKNSLQGNIPEKLSRCSNLAFIDLSYNKLKGEIPSEIGKLSRISTLILFSNNFTGKVPSSFGNLTNLQVLSLGINNLEGNIPIELGQLSKLSFLELSSNFLSGSIPSSIYNLSLIEAFGAAKNSLSGSLPPNLGSIFPKLQRILLSINRFYGPLPSTLANASLLTQIDMQNNSFIGPLPNLGCLHNLQEVNFIYNSFVGNFEEFINSLSNSSNLKVLALDGNNIGGKFPSSIGNLSSTITWLGLSNANLSGNLPSEIGKLSNLSYLSVSQNNLIGGLPCTIGDLTELEQFYFYENKISGGFPSSIGKLTKLRIFSGRKNMLNGTLPSSFGNCTSLQGISLEKNRLSGPLPIELFNILSLSYGIRLNNNLFNGSLPLQMGNMMKNLGSLDLSNNQLSGTIPDALGSCQVLETLYLQGNFFNGSIPDSFAQLKGIRIIDISNNHLSGNVPLFLALMKIERLNISYNSFDGKVPMQGVFGNISAFSIVGNDNLCGGIKELNLPSCPKESFSSERKKQLYILIIVPIATILPILSLLLFIRKSKITPSSTLYLKEKYPKISFGELSIATNGFSLSNLVGEGRYGSVYRGVLDVMNNEIMAVKVLNLQENGANKSFMAECEALRSIRHRNLVKIITACSTVDFRGESFKALVYEFMPNGSLESWLHPSLSQEPKVLTLLQRLNIAIDVATALDYLHNNSEPTIVHCDIKPGNILLGNDFCARLSDFGLAKILLTSPEDSNQLSTSVLIRGTIGYVAPEYAMSFEVSKEGDMFSYGILLLQIFTGKRPTSSFFPENTSLRDYVKTSLRNQDMEIVDPQILLQEEEEPPRANSVFNFCLGSILEIGVLCSNELPRERMDSKNVLVELHRIRNAYVSQSSQ